MSKTQQRDLAKVTRTIDQIAKAVEGLETSRTRGTPAWPDTVTRKSAQQARRFEKASEGLSALPAADEVVAEQARLRDLQARLDALVAEANGEAAEASSHAEAWEAHRQTEAYATDQQALHGFAVYDDVRFRLTHPGFRGLLRDTFERTLALVEDLPAVEARHAELVTRYEAFGREGRHMLDRLGDVRARLDACRQAMRKATAAGPEHLRALGERLDAETAKVLALRDQAQAAGRPFPLGYTLMDRTSVCRQLEDQIERSGTYLQRLEPGQAAQTQAAVASALAGYWKTVNAARAEIRAGQRAPADDYAGADADTVKAFVAQATADRTHGQAVHRVCLSGAWETTKSWKWDRTAQAWVELHQSSLAGTLLLEHDADDVFQRRIEVVRDHLRGDALQVFGDFQAYPEPRPDQLIPRDRLD